MLDDAHVEACARAARLHTELDGRIMELAEAAAASGEPILRCMEYVFPHQVTACFGDR